MAPCEARRVSWSPLLNIPTPNCSSHNLSSFSVLPTTRSSGLKLRHHPSVLPFPMSNPWAHPIIPTCKAHPESDLILPPPCYPPWLWSPPSLTWKTATASPQLSQFLLKFHGEKPSWPLPASGDSMCFLIGGYLTPISASVFIWPSSLCLLFLLQRSPLIGLCI